MGQTQVQLKQNQDYCLIEELPVGNIVKHSKTQTLHFLKQYSFTAQQAYQNALNTFSLKLVNKNQHVLNFMHFTTKSQNSFCSTFHKIILIFQYLDYSLQKQIANRIKDNRPFNQKQMWSVLCSCVLASAHLIHCQGKMHCGLTPKDIRLSQSGCVKLLSHEMIGIDVTHSQNEGLPKTLALTLIQCIKLSKLSNQQNSYLQMVIQGLQSSKEMKDVLLMMIKKNIKFTQLEQHLFKLVQDDQSIASQSNTPILKSQNSIGSNYKNSKNYRNQDILKYSKALSQKFTQLQPSHFDGEDTSSSTYLMLPCQSQVQNPDEIQQSTNDEQNKDKQTELQAHEQVNAFYLKQKSQQKNTQASYNISKDNKLINNILIEGKDDQQTGEQQLIKKIGEQKQQSSIAQKQGIDLALSNTTGKKEQNLFTDPKFFSLIKSNLEEIKMSRSIGEKNKLNKMQQSNLSLYNNNNQYHHHFQSFSSHNFNNNYPAPEQMQPFTHLPSQQIKLFEKQLPNSTHFKIQQQYAVNGFNSIENTNYQEETKNKRKNSTKQVQFIQKNEGKNDIDTKIQHKGYNILDNNEIGFKKKKQSTGKFQSLKQNTLSEPMKQKIQNFNKGLKNQQDLGNKRKNIAINSGDMQSSASSNRQEQLMKELSGYQGHSARCSSVRENVIKDEENFIQVSEKYNRGRYEGTKLNGKRHGYGTFYYSEGGKYVGKWQFNKMHGKGVLYYPNNQIAYDGEWKNDQLSGYGTLFNEQVVNLQTPFDYSDWSNVEDYWVKYEGYFYQDNKEGSGKLYLVNAQRFQGEFHDDKVDGEGILYLNDGGSVKGKWSQNKLIRIF